MKWWQLNPRTGVVLREVSVPVHPYGGVVTSDGKLWIGTLGDGGTAYIDTQTGEPSVKIAYPLSWRTSSCVNSYGITADSHGRIWFAGWGCNDALGFDPRSGVWTRVDTTPFGMTAGRGITVDNSGFIWMALGGDGASNVAIWDSTGFVPNGNMSSLAVQVVPLPEGHTGPSGVGADKEGYIWVAHHDTSQLVRINPETLAMDSYEGPNRVYTYSDFTGSVRRTVIGRGSYHQEFDAGCEAPDWTELHWDIETPDESSVSISIKTATTVEGLEEADPIEIAEIPGNESPANLNEILAALEIPPSQFLRLSLTLRASSSGTSPIVRSFDLRWFCND